MDSTSIASSVSAKAPNFVAGILASIGDALNSDADDAKLFSAFLSSPAFLTTATSSTVPSLNTNGSSLRKTTTNTENNTEAATSTAATVAPTTTPATSTTDLTSAWQDLLKKLRERAESKVSQSKVSSTDQSSTSDSSSSASSTADKGGGGVVSATAPLSAQEVKKATKIATTAPASDATSSIESIDTTTSTSNQATIPDVLAALQKFAQLIEKKLQTTNKTTSTTSIEDTNGVASSSASAATSATGGPATGSSGTTSPATPVASSDPLTASNILTEMLALVRLTEKKLELPSGGNNASTTVAAAGAQSNQIAGTTSSSGSKVNPDLKNLLAAVQSSFTGASNAATPAVNNTVVPTTSSTSASTSTDASTAAATTNSSSSTQSDETDTKDLAGVVESFFDTLKNSFVNATPAITASLTAFSATASAESESEVDPIVELNANNTTTSSANTASALAMNNGSATEGSKSSNPYNFASQLSATRPTNGTTGLPSAVEQVILQLNRNVKTGNDQMTIQLHPADLGSIKVKLDISSDGKVQGTIVASNPATLHLLLKDVRSLERSLQEAGLSADPGSLQFSLGGQTGNSQNQASGKSSSGAANGGDGTDGTGVLADGSTDATEIYYLTPNRVNMKV